MRGNIFVAQARWMEKNRTLSGLKMILGKAQWLNGRPVYIKGHISIYKMIPFARFKA